MVLKTEAKIIITNLVPQSLHHKNAHGIATIEEPIELFE